MIFSLLVVSFNSNGEAKICRVQEIPISLNRISSQFTGIEGDWNIVNYPQHPECIGCAFHIKNQGQNNYSLHTRVVNSMNCTLKHNPTNNECKASPVMSTMMAGSPDEMRRESLVGSLISDIQSVNVQGQQQLVIQTKNGQQASLERFAVAAPPAVTENIFR